MDIKELSARVSKLEQDIQRGAHQFTIHPSATIEATTLNNRAVALGLVSTAAGGTGKNEGVALIAGTQTATSGSVSFANSNGITFGMSNNSVITASVAGAPNRSHMEILNGERLTTVRNLSEAAFSRRPVFQPFWLDGAGLQASTVRLLVSGAASSNRSLVGTMSVALYSAANATQLSLFGTASQAFNYTNSSQSTVWNGPRFMDFTGITGSMQEGRWVLGMYVSASQHDATFFNMPIYGADNMPALSGYFVGGTTSATNNTSLMVPFWGVYSTTTNAFPSTVGMTQINGGNSASVLDMYALIKQV